MLTAMLTSCSNPADQVLTLSDGETKTHLVAELTKQKIHHQLGSDNTIQFAQDDKKEVYKVLNQILEAKGDEPISVSCEPNGQETPPASSQE